MTTEAAIKAWETRRANGWVHPRTLEKQEAETRAAARAAARKKKTLRKGAKKRRANG